MPDDPPPKAPPSPPEPTANAPQPRHPAEGDVLPATTERGMERLKVKERLSAARASKEAALRDIIAIAPAESGPRLARALEAMFQGASPDDVRALREALLRREEEPTEHPDEALSSTWRRGGYPYRNLMLRKTYEKEKYRLQVELLKLQAWVKETGQKVVILFEGRDAAGKGGTIKRFMEHLNPRGARVIAL
ncbi:MAG: hypothetical protein R3A48_29495, partial [Polyangiales bacterium]